MKNCYEYIWDFSTGNHIENFVITSCELLIVCNEQCLTRIKM